MARGQGSTVSVRWGSVVVRRGRMCAAVRGASAARRREAVGGGSRRRGFVGCICGVGWCRRWCKSEQAKSRRVDVRGDDCSRFCAAAKTGMRFGMQGMEEKKNEALGDLEEVRSSGRSGNGAFQGRPQRRMGQCGRAAQQPRTTAFRLLGVDLFSVELTGSLCDAVWYLISAARKCCSREAFLSAGARVVIFRSSSPPARQGEEFLKMYESIPPHANGQANTSSRLMPDVTAE